MPVNPVGVQHGASSPLHPPDILVLVADGRASGGGVLKEVFVELHIEVEDYAV